MKIRINCTKKIASFGIMSLFMIGCGVGNSNSKKPTVYESGYFKYIFLGENSIYQENKDDKSIVIIGFTEKGLNQSTIDIPREIDGNIVTYIGLRDEDPWHDQSHRVIVNSDYNLKKIFIFSNISQIDYFEGKDVDLMICSETLNFDKYSIVAKNKYLYKKLYDEIGKPSNEIYKSANVSFYNNYLDKNDLYRIDNVEESGFLPKPLDPIRENYTFSGWYTESECINLFDFESSPHIIDGVFNLYAGWNNN